MNPRRRRLARHRRTGRSFFARVYPIALTITRDRPVDLVWDARTNELRFLQDGRPTIHLSTAFDWTRVQTHEARP